MAARNRWTLVFFLNHSFVSQLTKKNWFLVKGAKLSVSGLHSIQKLSFYLTFIFFTQKSVMFWFTSFLQSIWEIARSIFIKTTVDDKSPLVRMFISVFSQFPPNTIIIFNSICDWVNYALTFISPEAVSGNRWNLKISTFFLSWLKFSNWILYIETCKFWSVVEVLSGFWDFQTDGNANRKCK